MAGDVPAQAPAAPVPPTPGSPEHDAAMVKVVTDTAASLEALKPPVPAAPAATPPAAEPPAAPSTEAPAPPPPAVNPAEVLGAARSEYASTGQLSEASYASLAAAGYDKALVDTFIEGQKAVQAQRDAALYQAIGGKESFQKMAAWAGTALTPAEITVFNASLTGSQEQASQAVMALKGRYEAAFGHDPKLINGNGSGQEQTGAYASWAQVTEAMADRRYKNDPAYRREVERRTGLMGNQ